MSEESLVSSLRQNSIQILDGGLATELESRGHILDHELWASLLLMEQPQEIATVHTSYLEAGADIVTSASYQATLEGFLEIGKNKSEAANLIASSVRLARTACDSFDALHGNVDTRKKVAAGVGPYGAWLADGSEYQGNYGLDVSQLYRFHKERWEILLSESPDLVICETIPNLQEANALILLANETDLPVWISLSCKDDESIRDGTPIELVAELIVESEACGLGINCTNPRYLPGLLTRIRRACVSVPLLVYPNSGETYDAATGSWSGESAACRFSDLAKDWLPYSPAIIGGCCRTTPDHIRAIKRLTLTATQLGSSGMET